MVIFGMERVVISAISIQHPDSDTLYIENIDVGEDGKDRQYVCYAVVVLYSVMVLQHLEQS